MKRFLSLCSLLFVLGLFTSCIVIGGEKFEYESYNSSLSLKVGSYNYMFNVKDSSSSKFYANTKFSSSDTSVATVSKDGLIYAVGAGETTIIATFEKSVNGELYKYCEVSVSDVDGSVKLFDKDSCYLGIGETFTLNCKTTDVDTSSLIWSSSNDAVATVSSSGVVTGIAKGSCVVTVQSFLNSKISASCCFEVGDFDSKITGINVDFTTLDLEVGKEKTLSANVVSTDSGNYDVIWTSSDTSVATIENNVITGVGTGTATITGTPKKNPAYSTSFNVTVVRGEVISYSYFWGSWIRMDTGKEYEINEKTLTLGGTEYDIIGATETTLFVDSLGKFEKSTDAVMNTFVTYEGNEEPTAIPMFRKGGVNLEYKLKVVGFEEDSARSAAGFTAKGMPGVEVKSKSKKYSTYSDSKVTDAEGDVTLIAPVVGDVQDLTIEKDENVFTVSDLQINNTGDYMGTIPLVDKNDYSLKVTGTIKQEDRTNGYLYVNQAYPLHLTITNISAKSSQSSILTIKTEEGSSLRVFGDTYDTSKVEAIIKGTEEDNSKYDLEGTAISTLKSNKSKTIDLTVYCSDITTPYVNENLIIEVENISTSKKWVDYVPLRFFMGDMDITIAPKSAEDNNQAYLNGFLMYPDGNSKYFSIKESGEATITVPVFQKDDYYLMAFSGASVEGTLDNSTELFYSVIINNKDKKSPDIITSGSKLKDFMRFGEPNEDEDNAYEITADENEFEAYLQEGEVDYYKFAIDIAASDITKKSEE